MSRFISTLTEKQKLDNVEQIPGQMILCGDSGELFFDTPLEESSRVQVGGKASKSYNITLLSNKWTYINGEYIQRPEYSLEIFGGKTYDPDINILVNCYQNIPSPITARAAEVEGVYIMEFVTKVAPSEDVIMNIVTI